METLERAVDSIAEANGFSGVVRVDRGDDVELAKAYGLAHRGYGIPNTVDTQFAHRERHEGPDGARGRESDRGRLARALDDGTLGARRRSPADRRRRDDRAPARAPIGHRRLPRRGGRLRRHRLRDAGSRARAGDDGAVPRRCSTGTPPGFRPANGSPTTTAAYVVLALIAERASGVPFHELVRERVCEPAGMDDTAFLRSDELPGTRGARVPHDRRRRTDERASPVRCGAPATAGSTRPWRTSARSGARSSPVGSSRPTGLRSWCGRAATCREQPRRYGLGFWLHESSDVVMLVGSDAGVSFWSAHDPKRATTATVISNTSDGAWPIARLLAESL